MRRSRGLLGEIIAFTLVIIVVFVSSILYFHRENSAAILERNREFLLENTAYHVDMTAELMNSRKEFVGNLATMLGELSEYDPMEITDTLNAMEDNTSIDDLFFVTPEGIRYLPSGQTYNLEGLDFYIEGMKGNSGITGITDSELFRNQQVISCYAPIVVNNEIKGIVAGCNYYDDFSDLFESAGEETQTYSFLIDRQGKILLSDREWDAETVLPFLERNMEGEEYENLRQELADGKSGVYSYRGEVGKSLVCFSSLEINDWLIMQFWRSEASLEMVEPLNRASYVVEAIMLLVMAAVLLFSIYIAYRKYNSKNMLMNEALDALAEVYPRIARINYSTAECVFIRDQDDTMSATFEKYDWNEFRVPFLESIHPEDREKCRLYTSPENMRRVREQGLMSDTCIYRRLYRGEFQWMQAVLISAKEPNCMMMYVRSVDESVRSEQLYKEQLWEALQKAKDAETAKEEFLKYMSHDLRTPMNAVLGMNTLAKTAAEKGELSQALHYLEWVDSMGNYMLTMLNDILRVSILKERHVSSIKKPFSIQNMLQCCLEYYTAIDRSKRKISFRVEIDEGLQQQYNGDESRLIQILDALLSNAFKFSREGGSVVLKVRLAEAGTKCDRVSFSVRDTGCGIDEKALPTIFELFSKERQLTGETGAGVGLGLTFVKLALEAMDGEIQVESKPGEGSCFTVSLELEHVGQVSDNISEAAEKKEHACVLVVDDNELNLEIASKILEANGFNTVSCDTGAEALQLFRESAPGTFDVLLTDIKMPEMDGHELARRVRESGHADSGDICIIALSANGDDEERRRARESGMNDFLEKPFKIQQFKQSIQKVIS